VAAHSSRITSTSLRPRFDIIAQPSHDLGGPADIRLAERGAYVLVYGGIGIAARSPWTLLLTLAIALYVMRLGAR
jgi:hypothetical protein